MTLSVKYFHATTHLKNILMSQVQYARQYLKEALNRSHPWSAYYFTSRKGSWHPSLESCIDYRTLSLILMKKAASVCIAVSDEEKLRTRADSYT